MVSAWWLGAAFAAGWFTYDAILCAWYWHKKKKMVEAFRKEFVDE